MTFGKLNIKVRKKKKKRVKKEGGRRDGQREERKRKGKIENKIGTSRKSPLLLELEEGACQEYKWAVSSYANSNPAH